MGYYDIAQFCINGHLITEYAASSPEFQKKFCPRCGAETVKTCKHCNSPIHGYHHVPGVIDMTARKGKAPAFCYECGKPHPWTEKKIENFKELTLEIEELGDQDRAKLNQSLDELVQDGPKVEVASLKFKKIVSKLGRDSYALVKDVVTDVVSETVKKSLFGS